MLKIQSKIFRSPIDCDQVRDKYVESFIKLVHLFVFTTHKT